MNRTQSYHSRENNRNRSLFSNDNRPFKQVEQTYVYPNLTKPVNPESNFDISVKPRQRTKWEMKKSYILAGVASSLSCDQRERDENTVAVEHA